MKVNHTHRQQTHKKREQNTEWTTVAVALLALVEGYPVGNDEETKRRKGKKNERDVTAAA